MILALNKSGGKEMKGGNDPEKLCLQTFVLRTYTLERHRLSGLKNLKLWTWHEMILTGRAPGTFGKRMSPGSLGTPYK